MGNFTADQIVGASMYAKERVPIKNGPFPDSAIIRYAEQGQLIGIVDSWNDVNASTGITRLHWVFRDLNESLYYVAHNRSMLEVSNIYTLPIVPPSIGDQFVSVAKWGIGGLLLIKAAQLLIR